MRSNPWKMISLLLLTGSLGTAAAPAVRTFDLGSQGEITHWLALAYVPIPSGRDTWAASLDADLLQGAGGEAAAAPFGGQTVTAGLPGAQAALVWRVAETESPNLVYAWQRLRRLPLFQADGRYLENTAVYLYCELVAAQATNANLLVGSDDSVRVVLNGQPAFRYCGQRSISPDQNCVPVALRRGTNTLLLRVDNYVGDGGLVARLADAFNGPLPGVQVALRADAGAPALPVARRAPKPWAEVVAEIPPVPPAPHQELFGARLARTLTLLESGGQTRRPVRILFYGQSITAQEWTQLLVDRLQERYPDTTIEPQNLALGGWGVHMLCRTLKHDILRSRPDLVVFHAYSGTPEQWERVIQNIRRETTADILLKTPHLAGTNDAALARPEEDAYTFLIRRMAQTYDCELVEIQREWGQYLRANQLGVTNMLCDSIHLNRAGNVLMAQLYERHFRMNTLTRSGWADRVRWYEALRPIEERKNDEILLDGAGWKASEHAVESASSKDALRLRFTGNRVDVALAPCSGSARVLIDGKPPSAWNLTHATLPRVPGYGWPVPSSLMRLFEGPTRVLETWRLTFTDKLDEKGAKFRYRIEGSATGPDGEGDSEHDFTSRSGRVAIRAVDWRRDGSWPDATNKPAAPPQLLWAIVSDGRDTIRGTLSAPGPLEWFAPAFTWVTVADGLPFGEHELKLVPVGDAPIAIRGIEVHRPPLAEAPAKR